jgi:hypothetical protein
MKKKHSIERQKLSSEVVLTNYTDYVKKFRFYQKNPGISPKICIKSPFLL